MKHLLFYIHYKICKHSLIKIDFIASVYELFDNPSYLSGKHFCSCIPLAAEQKKVLNPLKETFCLSFEYNSNLLNITRIYS